MSSRAQPRAEGTPTLKLPERYRIRRHLATGGMASVWCAEDLVLGRTVAIKVLARRFADDEVAVRRFKREARAAARVSNHTHVVTIYDVGDAPADDSDPHGPAQAFIVMEHLSGGTVADAQRVGTINRREALRWLREAASALDHAHGRGIVHRDIKPANFLLDGSRVLHVADFGIARLVSEDTITTAGELFGTAAYLAPEQALGREATGASDRYALAVAGFELLTGERPFAAQHFAAQARQHIEDPPPSASDRNRLLPAAVDPVLAQGMAKDPAARFETAGAMVLALEDALSTPVPASTRTLPSAVRGRERLGVRGHRRAFGFAALLVAVLAIGGVAIAGLGGSSHPVSSPANAPRVATVTAHRPVKHRQVVAKSAASSSTTTAEAAGSPTTTPATPVVSSAQELQLTGHQELSSGDYQQAIPTLRQAVSAASPGSLTYAYALYDLGRSLTLAGDPSGAIPILQQRMKIRNQTPVVEQALNQAMRAAGQAPSPTPSPSAQQPTSSKPVIPTKPSSKPARPIKPATPPPVNSGGAGLAPSTSVHGHHDQDENG